MNKGIKILLSILGAVDAVLTFMIPIAFVLMLVSFYDFTSVSLFGFVFNATPIIIAVGLISSLFRAIKIGFIENE